MKPLDLIRLFGRESQLHVLIYHRVLSEFDPLRSQEMTRDRFEMHLKILKKKFNVVPLVQGYHRLMEGTLPPKAVSITFDDGYQDNVDIALPLLKSYGFQASFFIATGFLNEGLMFNDQVIERIRRFNDIFYLDSHTYDCSTLSGKLGAIETLIRKIKPLTLEQRVLSLNALLPETTLLPRLMMKDSGLKSLAAGGMHIGAHTVHHPLLSCVDDEVAFHEILSSKRTLEDILQKQIAWFAYPNGKRGQDYSDKHANMLKDLGFVAALSTDWGMVRKDSDPFHLPRFTPWQQSRFKFGMKMSMHRLTSAY